MRTHTEYASVTLFVKAGWRTAFTPERAAIETLQGEVVQERRDARKSFDGHTMNMPWDPLHRAYFNGYALRLYLTAPFFMVMPGFELTEIEPWKEGGETWRAGMITTSMSQAVSPPRSCNSSFSNFLFSADTLAIWPTGC